MLQLYMLKMFELTEEQIGDAAIVVVGGAGWRGNEDGLHNATSY
jgi:hypothetical protein